MGLSVIGTGFGRTGTDSLREALGILGFGPCHHMMEVNRNEDQKRLWRAFAKGAFPGWDALFQGYRSCVDWPSAHYWRELVVAYPDAKVILTARTAESWWTSFEQTILEGIRNVTDQEALGVTLIRDQVFGGRPEDRESAIAVYEANVRDVMETVAPDRLLVHHPADGWGPLCAHLDVAVPEVPYPSRNTAKEFKEAILAPLTPKL